MSVRPRPLTRPTLASPARRSALDGDGASAWVTVDVSKYNQRHVLVVRGLGDGRFAAAAFLFDMSIEAVRSVLAEASLEVAEVERLRAFLESRDGKMTPCGLDDARLAIEGGLAHAGGADAVSGAREALALIEGRS